MSTKICKQSAYVNTLKSNTVHVGKSKKNLHCPTKTCAELGSLNRPVESLKEAIQLVKDKKMDNVSVLMAAGDYSKTDFDLEIPKEIRQIIGEGRSVTTIGNGLQIKHSLDLQDLTIGTDPRKMAITLDYGGADARADTTVEEVKDEFNSTRIKVFGYTEGTFTGANANKASVLNNFRYRLEEAYCEHVATSTSERPCTRIVVRNGARVEHHKNHIIQSFKQGDDDDSGKPLREKIVDATSSIQSSIGDSETRYEICNPIGIINHHDIKGTYEHKRNNTQRKVVSCPGYKLMEDLHMNGYNNEGTTAIRDVGSSVVDFSGLSGTDDASSGKMKFVSHVVNNGSILSDTIGRTTIGGSGRKILNGTTSQNVSKASEPSGVFITMTSTGEIHRSLNLADDVPRAGTEPAGVVADTTTANGAQTTMTASGTVAPAYKWVNSQQDKSSRTSYTLTNAQVAGLGTYGSPSCGTPNLCCAVAADNVEANLRGFGGSLAAARTGALEEPLVGSFENALVQLSSVRSSGGELHLIGAAQANMDNVGLINTAVKSFGDEETGNRPTIEFLKSRSSHSTDHNFELEHGTSFKAASSILQHEGANSLVSFRASKLARSTNKGDIISNGEFAACQLLQNSDGSKGESQPMIWVGENSPGFTIVMGTSSTAGTYSTVIDNDPLNRQGTFVSSASNLFGGSNKLKRVALVTLPDKPEAA